MACATLKRSLDFDPVHSPGIAAKRRRCSQMYMTPLSPTKTESPFEGVFPKITAESMAARIREELHRASRRRQFYAAPECQESTSDVSMDSPGSPQGSNAVSQFGGMKEKHLFTFQQVTMICERMLKEQEGRIREEYDRVLNAKLSEQYETFVKFTYDQLQKKFEGGGEPSYLS